jgi:hypothetical protein
VSLPPISLRDLDNAPTEIHPEDGAPTPDESAILQQRLIEVSAELESVKQEFDTYKRRNRAADILNTLIEPYAKKIFWFMVWYCIVVAVFLFVNAIGWFSNTIGDSVLQLLVGSTATTVLGLVGMVVAGIFNGARKSEDGLSSPKVKSAKRKAKASSGT